MSVFAAGGIRSPIVVVGSGMVVVVVLCGVGLTGEPWVPSFVVPGELVVVDVVGRVVVIPAVDVAVEIEVEEEVALVPGVVVRAQ